MATFLEELRIEVLSQEPFHSFISSLEDNQRKYLLSNSEYLFVTFNYNWKRIKECLEDVVSCYTTEIEEDISKLLLQAVKYSKIDDPQEDNKPLHFLNKIVIGTFCNSFEEEVKRSLQIKYKEGYLFSLDTLLMTTRFQDKMRFGFFVSSSRAKLRYAINILQRQLWPSLIIEDIVTKITSNKGKKYYNISESCLITAASVKKMTNVSTKHKFASSSDDNPLFEHIVNLLESGLHTTPKIVNTNNPKRVIRKNIPQKVRQMVWRKFIGNSMDGKCWVCDCNISFESWQAGHIIPACNGGPDHVENLRPICTSCNSSMGTMHMNSFVKHYNMKGKAAEEFKDHGS